MGRYSSTIQAMWLWRSDVDIVAIGVAVDVSIAVYIAVGTIHTVHAVGWWVTGVWLWWHLVETI